MTVKEWVTVREAARRLGMSPSWFRDMAKCEQIPIERRGRQPGVDWSAVEALISRARITKMNEGTLRQLDSERPLSFG
jgi:hypothetical protein